MRAVRFILIAALSLVTAVLYTIASAQGPAAAGQVQAITGVVFENVRIFDGVSGPFGASLRARVGGQV